MSPIYRAGCPCSHEFRICSLIYGSKVKRFSGVLIDENYCALELKNFRVNSNGNFA